MENGERKSSEDLIREANERLRGSARREEDPVQSLDSSSEEPSPEGRGPADRAPDGRANPAVSPPGPDEDRSPGRSRNLKTLIRWALIALFIGGGYLFSTFGSADRDGSGEIVGSGDLDVMSLQVGDCFDDPEDLEDVVYDVAAVPCAEAHDNEVFAVQSLADAFPRSFPGEDVLWDYSYEVCSGSLFDSYVGTPYLDSSLDVFTLTPTEESWEEGDREFVCAVFRLDGRKLTGTARDSGL